LTPPYHSAGVGLDEEIASKKSRGTVERLERSAAFNGFDEAKFERLERSESWSREAKRFNGF
jgi:hypothetical protein